MADPWADGDAMNGWGWARLAASLIIIFSGLRLLQTTALVLEAFGTPNPNAPWVWVWLWRGLRGRGWS